MLVEIIVVSIVILALITLIVKRFVYFRPHSAFLPIEDVYQDVYQGNIHAWYKKGGSGYAILICHGNGGNISYFQSYIHGFHRMGHSVLIFDYSGYGISKGVPSEELIYNNTIQMYQHLIKTGYPKDYIIPVGISLGGAPASYLAYKYNLPKLILIASLPSIKLLIQHKLPKLKLLGFLFPEFDTVYHLSLYQGKTLLVHSQEDELIPYDATYNMQSYCTTVIPITGQHNDTDTIPWNHIEVWLINT